MKNISNEASFADQQVFKNQGLQKFAQIFLSFFYGNKDIFD